eukprot:2382758-Rhodomonas_salina.2
MCVSCVWCLGHSNTRRRRQARNSLRPADSSRAFKPINHTAGSEEQNRRACEPLGSTSKQGRVQNRPGALPSARSPCASACSGPQHAVSVAGNAPHA